MNSQRIAGILGTIVAAIVLVAAFAYGPIGQFGKPPASQVKTEQPAPAVPAPPPVKGPVVREVPQ